MKRVLFLTVGLVCVAIVHTGVGGLLVNGVVKAWDDVARAALKVGGRDATDDAVQSTAKTLEARRRGEERRMAETTVRTRRELCRAGMVALFDEGLDEGTRA